MSLAVRVVRSSVAARFPRLRHRLIILCAAAAARSPSGPIRWGISPCGHRLMCDLRDPMQSQIYFLGRYSEEEIDHLRAHLHPGDVFVDVGANIGLFSLELSGVIIPNGKVFAFEPASDTADQLRRNVAANSLEEVVEVVPMALGDAAEELPLRAPEDRHDDTGRRSLSGSGPTVEWVPVAVFDDLVRDGRIDLDHGLHAVKVDVEGAELAVLRGMRQSLHTHRPRIILVETIEANLAAFGSSTSDVDRLLLSVGYGRRSPQGALNSIYTSVEVASSP